MHEDTKMNKSVAIGIFILVVAVLVYITINHTNKEVPVAPTDAAALSLQGAMNNTTDQTGTQMTMDVPGVQITILKEGTGAVAKAGDTVAMNYTGTLDDGTVFDSNVDPKFGHLEGFVFPLGEGKVIKGWDAGVEGMKVGEKRKLVIASDYAYGASGAGGVIPPNATLTFEVELLAIKP